MEKDIIISIDVGGTTFESSILNKNCLDIIAISEKWHVGDYSTSQELFDAINSQINDLLNIKTIDKKRVFGLSVACPGPIDINSGTILDTPNLKLFRNYPLKDKLAEKFTCKICIENDANLFALGEWFLTHQKYSSFIGVTIGTGLGFGIVIDGKLFKGANGMAAEYGLSSCEWGTWEDKVSLKFIRNDIKKTYNKNLSPRTIQKYASDKDIKAQNIFNRLGQNLGLPISHIINMLDPGVIVLGGGLSSAFNLYKKELKQTIHNNSVVYKNNPCTILESNFKSKSQMVGGALNLIQP